MYNPKFRFVTNFLNIVTTLNLYLNFKSDLKSAIINLNHLENDKLTFFFTQKFRLILELNCNVQKCFMIKSINTLN